MELAGFASGSETPPHADCKDLGPGRRYCGEAMTVGKKDYESRIVQIIIYDLPLVIKKPSL